MALRRTEIGSHARRRARLVFLSVVATAMAIAAAAPAEAKRLALVIGNNDYLEVTPLQKAVNDARTTAAALESAGFDVIADVNLTRRDMNRELQNFYSRIEVGDEVLFFFAGHGIEIDGRNYLLPTDIPLASPGQDDFVRSEAIVVDELVDRITGRGARMAILVLDACRDNPFPRNGTRSLGGARGLARMHAPEGTFIMYSAGVGQLALDRLSDDDEHPNSVFTRSLVPLISEPGRSLVSAARQVRREVERLAASISHEQRPAYYDEVTGDFFFTAAETRPVAPPGTESAGEVWAQIQDRAGSAVLKAFVAQFPDSVYARLAQARIAEIEAVGGAPASTPPPAPEEVAVASVDPADTPATPEAPASPQVDTRALVRDIQTELQQRNCRPGTADGIWGRRSRQALQRLDAETEADLPTEPNAALLRALRDLTGTTCPEATVATRSTGGEATSRSSCRRWQVQVAELKPGGLPWDAVGPPDIQITEGSTGAQAFCRDSRSCTLTFEGAIGDASLTIMDMDLSEHDTIGVGTCRASASRCQIGSATVSQSNC